MPSPWIVPTLSAALLASSPQAPVSLTAPTIGLSAFNLPTHAQMTPPAKHTANNQTYGLNAFNLPTSTHGQPLGLRSFCPSQQKKNKHV